MGKEVRYYDTDLLTLDDSEVDDSKPLYTLDKSRKSPLYLEFMDYITGVFENKTSDLDYWINYFMSLDLVQTSEQMRDTLLTLASRNVKMDIEFDNYIAPLHSDRDRQYEAMVDRINSLSITPSDKALYYSDKL